MMRHPTSQGERAQRGQLIRRLDRAFGELNVFLTALAIGLALLDLTCLYGVTVSRPLIAALHVQPPQSVAWPGLVPGLRQRSDDASQ
ncbi:MAG TPA: hypothetical protein VGR91_07920 [Stellaceae bacterium]|nr:hypothetical protein [Stellaceae bacterium]